MSARLSVREFAKRAGCDEKQVRRALEKGLISKGDDGLLAESDVDSQWRKPNRRGVERLSAQPVRTTAHVRTRRGRAVNTAAARVVRTDETVEQAAERIVTAGGLLPLKEALELKENYLARHQQLSYDLKAGTVVLIEEVAKTIGAEYAGVRKKLLAIPSERAPAIHRLKTVPEVEDYLRTVIVEALEELPTMAHLQPDADVYAAGTAALAQALFDARRRNLQPPPKLTLSQWAARYAVLSAETSAQTGRFRAYAYQVGMMDAVTDPSVVRVTIMKSARVGYTKILDHIAGYYIHQDPSPMLTVQPRVEDAEDYSSTEIEPMLRDTPVLAEIVGDLKAKGAKQKLLKRVFPNGSSMSFVGANSPGGFRRITARIIKFDEVDGYPVLGAGDDGDQIRLGERRAQTFWNRKIILGSTPLIKGESRIEKSYLRSDQRKFYVPCPQCGEYQVLEWGGPMLPYGMKWDKDEAGNGLPDTAYYLCRHNGCIIRDADKPEMLDRGEWRASAPFKDHAGFHIWTGYSLDPNASWPALVAEWLEVAYDPLERKTFFNLVLGEPYEERGERALSEDKLLERCEVWAAEIPDGAAVLTFGGDVQPDRVEIEHVAWGRNEESWSIAYKVFPGDPNEPEFWVEIDEYLKREWLRADGRPFVVKGGCIDTGGANTNAVYNFVKPRFRRNIWGIKGASEIGGVRKPIWPPTLQLSKTRGKYTPVQIGTTSAKDSIRSRLHQEKPGSGYMHFPADRDRNYFAQLTAERLVDKKGRGRTFKVWECPKNRANEALDCRVYAFAALVGLQQGGLALNRTADEVGAAYTVIEVSVPASAPVVVDVGTGAVVTTEPAEPVKMLVKVGEAPPRPKPGSRAALLAS